MYLSQGVGWWEWIPLKRGNDSWCTIYFSGTMHRPRKLILKGSKFTITLILPMVVGATAARGRGGRTAASARRDLPPLQSSHRHVVGHCLTNHSFRKLSAKLKQAVKSNRIIHCFNSINVKSPKVNKWKSRSCISLSLFTVIDSRGHAVKSNVNIVKKELYRDALRISYIGIP